MSDSDLRLPPQSPIKIRKTARGIEMRWEPLMGCGPIRYFPAAFLAFWLCGWFVGEVFAIFALGWSIIKLQIIPALFLIVWLAGWSFGGYFAIRMLKAMMQPQRPERLYFEEHLLLHDAGFTPMFFNAAPASLPKRHTPEGEMYEVRKDLVQDIRLERYPKGRLRLMIEMGDGKVEIGMLLGKSDKQWLYQRLCDWWGQDGTIC